MPDHILSIQGPHCLLDFERSGAAGATSEYECRGLVQRLASTLKMKRCGDPRIVSDGRGRVSIYQIVSTSHIIIHVGILSIHADLFSCEPFDMDACVRGLLAWVGQKGRLQYCQRNLLTTPRGMPALPMVNLNRLTSNPETFTHTMVNFYGGKENLLGDSRLGKKVLDESVELLQEVDGLPRSDVALIDVDPIPDSWDMGGFSGGYVNIMRQLTIHTFKGINGAFVDIMAHTYDLEEILRLIQDGFGFSYYEVDAVYQRSRPD